MPLDQDHEYEPDNTPDHDPHDEALYGPSPGEPGNIDPVHKTMPLGEHIEELRGRLVKALIGTVIAAIGTFYFGFQIIAWLAQPYLQAQEVMGFTPTFIQTDPTAGFTSVYLPVCLIAAAIVASPWIVFQAWQFVVSGLYEHEKKAVHILAPFSTVMVVLAVLFTYFILLPVSITFFLKFATYYPEIELADPNPVTNLVLKPYMTDTGTNLPEDFDYDSRPLQLPVLEERPEELKEGMLWIDGPTGRIEAVIDGKVRILSQRTTRLINPLPQLGEFVRFAAIMMLGIVAAFQLPVIMLVMGWSKLFDPTLFGKSRKYAFFACFAAGAILTPTDIFSMLVLAFPLYALFEFGLLLMKLGFGDGEMFPDET
ncbi:MAG: twin-arginine translocase subunit TatC [Planctomycetota bacterium]